MFEFLLDCERSESRGVSPVIGVILMVAITVILAAVIASFVLGFGDSVSQNVNAGADIEATQGDAADTGEIRVTWISEGNADTLNVSLSDYDNVTASEYKTIGSVGETVTFEESTAGDHEIRVTVVAEGDGQQTVITTETVTI